MVDIIREDVDASAEGCLSKDCRCATGLAVRSLLQAAKFLFHEQSQARPDEGEKACARTPLSRLLTLYQSTKVVNA